MPLSTCLRIPAVRGGLCTLGVLGVVAAAFFGSDAEPVRAATLTGKSDGVVALAKTYINSLSTTQQSSTVVSNVAHWSDLPAAPGTSGGATCGTASPTRI